MKFKIDTREKFHVIRISEGLLAANMTAELGEKLNSILQNDVKNAILNLKDIETLDNAAGEWLVTTQQKFYEQNASFVICEIRKQVEEELDGFGLLELLSTTPTESEASDIVQMEEIEREWMDDEPSLPAPE